MKVLLEITKPESILTRCRYAIKDTDQFTFDIALIALKQGIKVARNHWQAHTYAHEPKHLSIKTNTKFEGMTINQAIYETLVSGFEIPYIPSMKDLLSDDWQIIPPEPSRPL